MRPTNLPRHLQGSTNSQNQPLRKNLSFEAGIRRLTEVPGLAVGGPADTLAVDMDRAEVGVESRPGGLAMRSVGDTMVGAFPRQGRVEAGHGDGGATVGELDV
ncbi:unnamed protein product [Symbiodinium necroappetens]|uniref:Uncharacterized protein n=1 Tax=Symbiodinium necroappetens TaxID=1628268 RepID=A0A812LQ29_9DINO|nr:unnamed protein product [Symbiodinium necroappetens]